jgi:DUF1365 family protein
LRTLFSLPLVTFKIIAAIHWEALRLWLKRAPGASPGCRSCEHRQTRLGDDQAQRIY